MKNSKSQTIEAFGTQVDFLEGSVERVRSIGEFTIVEYADSGGCSAFRAYVKTQAIDTDYRSLDVALVGAIASKHEGAFNAHALKYLRRAVRSAQATSAHPLPLTKEETVAS